jgi:hypothetical protein
VFKTFGVSMTVALGARGLVAFPAAGVRGATPLQAVPLPAVLLPHGGSASAMVTGTHVLVAALHVVPLLHTHMLFWSTAPGGHGTQAVPLKIRPSVQLDCGFNTFKGVGWTATFGTVLLLPVREPTLAAPALPALRTRYSPRFSVHPRPMTRLSRKPGCVERPGMPLAEPSSESWSGSVLGFW